MQKIYRIMLAAVAMAVLQTALSIPARAAAEMPASAMAYQIDPAQSELRILVHHSSKIGHNHVIVNRHIRGEVKFTGDASTSSFNLTVPVSDFDVDDATASSEEGSDFAATFSASDRSETKGHMLGPKLLDGTRFAEITLVSTSVTASAGGFIATLAVTVAGHQSTLMVPFSFTHAAGQISASGSVVLRQTELGLKPLSFMMGAITIQDEITVKFKLLATAT